MTSDERVTVREIIDLLGDFRTEMGQRFDGVEGRLGVLERRQVGEDAVKIERAAVKAERVQSRATYRWLIGLALATAGSLAFGVLNLLRTM